MRPLPVTPTVQDTGRGARVNTEPRHRSEVEAPVTRTTVHVPAPRRSIDPLPAPDVSIGLLAPRAPRSRLTSWVVAVVAFLVVVPLIALAAFDWRLSSALTRIDGAFDGLGARASAATDGSVTMLMLATGPGTATSPELTWMAGEPSVVSAMFVTISGDRRQVNVDWLPLRGRVLAGVSDAAPSSSVAAAESWTGRRVDHLAVVEWSALSELGRDNDVRNELAPGAGRGQQQAYLREVLIDTLHAEMRKEPWTLYNALHTVAEGMAVEEDWSTLDMNRLVFSLRDLRSAQILIGSADEPVDR